MTAFQFDRVRLTSLEQQVPPKLQLLRLRLRFGLPRVLRIDQRFRISLELVDEMGQPAAESDLMGDLALQISHETNSVDVELKVRELASSCSRREGCRWSFDAEFSLKTVAPSNQSQDEIAAKHQSLDAPKEAMNVTFLLQIGLKASSKRTLADRTEFHEAFQQFCIHSEWIDAQTLVLPVQTQRIRLLPLASLPSGDFEELELARSSSLCSRVFSIIRPLQARKARVITVGENYGDTMGSHIWDASILLSFALCAASHLPPDHKSHTMLELGAGCGLFAAVYAALCEEDLDGAGATMVLTERSESLALLEANVKLNAVSGNTAEVAGDRVRRWAPAIQFLPLMWGDPIGKNALPRDGVDTIFAADVLYNWSSHEPLLRTIDAILQHQTPGTGCATSAVIAHKHRGSKAAASSAFLEQLLQGSSENCCDQKPLGECQWTNWHVSRAAKLGKVDILLLTRKLESHSTSIARSVS